MEYSMKMGHRWVLEAKIGLQWRNLAIGPPKLAFLASNWPLRPLKSNFLPLELLQHTLGHNCHGIFQENGSSRGCSSQNRPQMTDFSY